MWNSIKKWFGFTDINRDGKIDAKDFEFTKDLATSKIKQFNEKINEVVAEVEGRIKRVKEEATDVVVAVKEVANQVGDIADAAKGEQRKGRKKNK